MLFIRTLFSSEFSVKSQGDNFRRTQPQLFFWRLLARFWSSDIHRMSSSPEVPLETGLSFGNMPFSTSFGNMPFSTKDIGSVTISGKRRE